MPRRFPIQLLSIVLFLGLIFSASADGGEDFANAQVVWPVQERGRFAGHSRARGEAPRKNAQISDCGKTEFQKCGASNGMLRPRETQGAPRKITDQNFRTTSVFANRWGVPTSHHFRRRRKKQIPRFARNDRWKWILCAGS